MKRVGLLAVCAVSILAITAIVAASASALPQWGRCYQVAGTGHYQNSSCTTTAALHSGNYEWTKQLVKKRFADESGAPAILEGEYIVCEPSETVREPTCRAGETAEPIAVPRVECEASSASGELEEPKKMRDVKIVFQGCDMADIACTNTSSADDIETKPLKGELGYIDKLAKEVGLLLKPEVGKILAAFSCGAYSFKLGEAKPREGFAYPPAGGGDAVIAPITPVNTMSSTFTELYAIDPATFENIPPQFEVGPLRVLESYVFNTSDPVYTSKWSKAGLTATMNNFLEEEVEIKA